MNSLRCLALLVLSLAVSLALPAATPLAHLVSDRAAVIISIHDVPSILTHWEQSPWAKTWNDEQVKRFFAPLRAQMKADDWNTKVKDKTGYTLSELIGFATGDALVVLPDFDFARTTPVGTPHLLLAVEVGDHAEKLEALLLKETKDEKATDETSEFAGVVVHSIHPPESASSASQTPTVWAIADGKFFFSPAKDAVLNAIDALHNGGVTEAWDQSERYARLQQRAPDSQMIFSVNAEAIFPAVKEMLIERSKTAPMNGIDPNALLTAFGFDTWREIFGAVRWRDDRTEVRFGTTYSEARGLTKILAYHDGPPPTPPLVSPKWAGVSSAKLSLKDAFSAVEEILENFNPAISGMVQGQIRATNKKLGIDLKRDLLGSLGDSVISANIVPPPDPTGEAATGIPRLQQFFAVSLDDQDTFTKAVEAVRHGLGPNAESLFKTRDYLGEKIVTFQPGIPSASAASQQFNYTIAKGFLFVSVGSAAPLETALQCFVGHQASFWEKPEVKELFAQLPANASAFQYQDLRQMISAVFQSFAAANAMMNHVPHPTPTEENEAGAEAPQRIVPPKNGMVDPSAMPDAATIAQYWGFTWGYVQRDSTGIYFTSQIVYPK
jgi:hypothetical protein